jgi:hypothetical protein
MIFSEMQTSALRFWRLLSRRMFPHDEWSGKMAAPCAKAFQRLDNGHFAPKITAYG